MDYCPYLYLFKLNLVKNLYFLVQNYIFVLIICTVLTKNELER